MALGPRSSALTAVPLKPGQMMTPDKGFLSRSHVPGNDSPSIGELDLLTRP
jgi:hypothetical protein